MFAARYVLSPHIKQASSFLKRSSEQFHLVQQTRPLQLSVKDKAIPLQVWSGPQGSRKLRIPDFMTTQDGREVASLTHRPPLTPGNAPGTHFCYRLSRPQCHSAIGRILCQWKIPMTPAGMEPATVRFVAQHFNHCATAVPTTLSKYHYVPGTKWQVSHNKQNNFRHVTSLGRYVTKGHDFDAIRDVTWVTAAKKGENKLRNWNHESWCIRAILLVCMRESIRIRTMLYQQTCYNGTFRTWPYRVLPVQWIE